MAAMPFADVPAFWESLSTEADTLGRLGLMLVISTAARSGEVREALWGHIDLERREWRRPASLQRKTDKAHIVTLNEQAIDVLRRIAALTGSDDPGALVLSNRKGKPISDMTISKVMRDADIPFVPHGFRSSFRDWAAERRPDIPDPVAEAALGHTVPDAVVAAYKRTSFLDMRRTLLDAWGRFIGGGQAEIVRLALRRG